MTRLPTGLLLVLALAVALCFVDSAKADCRPGCVFIPSQFWPNLVGRCNSCGAGTPGTNEPPPSQPPPPRPCFNIANGAMALHSSYASCTNAQGVRVGSRQCRDGEWATIDGTCTEIVVTNEDGSIDPKIGRPTTKYAVPPRGP